MNSRGSFCQSFARCYHVGCSNVFPSDTWFNTTSNSNRDIVAWKRKTTLTKTPLWIKVTIIIKYIVFWEHKWGAVAPHHSSSEKLEKRAGKYGWAKFEGAPRIKPIILSGLWNVKAIMRQKQKERNHKEIWTMSKVKLSANKNFFKIV